MERVKEAVRNFVRARYYRSYRLIPGTTSYRDIDHEDDVTTSCAKGMASNSNDDLRFEVFNGDACESDVKKTVGAKV